MHRFGGFQISSQLHDSIIAQSTLVCPSTAPLTAAAANRHRACALRAHPLLARLPHSSLSCTRTTGSFLCVARRRSSTAVSSFLAARARLRAGARLKLPHTPASTGASLEIYRDCIPAHPGATSLPSPMAEMDPAAGVINRSRSRPLNLPYPIDNPPQLPAEYTPLHRSAT